MEETPGVRIYEPTSDWIGIGYNHWMIVHQWGPDGGQSHSGIGHTLEDAWVSFKRGSGICGTISKDDAVRMLRDGLGYYLHEPGICPVIYLEAANAL